MMTFDELPDTIPLFPLPGTLLLPRGKLPLHVFEPRYLRMVDDCLATPTRLIGMINYTPHRNEMRMMPIGCAGRITSFSETEEGRYMLTLTGICRFRLMNEVSSKTPYRCAQVNWGSFRRDLDAVEVDTGFDRAGFLSLLARYFQAHGLGTEWDGLFDADAGVLINTLSMILPFSTEDKQALLEAPSLQTRRETLVALLEMAMLDGYAGRQQ